MAHTMYVIIATLLWDLLESLTIVFHIMLEILEMPIFQTIKRGKDTFRYEAPKLWNM